MDLRSSYQAHFYAPSSPDLKSSHLWLCIPDVTVAVVCQGLVMEGVTKEEDPDADTGLEPEGNSKGFIVI